jgi:hypothetical protein
MMKCSVCPMHGVRYKKLPTAYDLSCTREKQGVFQPAANMKKEREKTVAIIIVISGTLASKG